MKGLTILIGLFSIAILSCTNETFDNSLNGSWKVISFENLTTGTTEFKTQENSWDKEIKVKFDDTVNPKAISGTNITNQIFGEFSLAGQNQFKVSNLGSTEVNQPRWADEFLKAILDQNLTFKITNDRLVIYYDNKTKSVTLKKE
jgi:heat shock protein HslJ